MTPAELVRLYHDDLGWRLVMVPANSKAPDRRGWQDAVPRVAEIERHVAQGGNIGLLLGPASGEFVDIDLDCLEAVALLHQRQRNSASCQHCRTSAASARSRTIYGAVSFYQDFANTLIPWERDFVTLISRRPDRPSEKQIAGALAARREMPRRREGRGMSTDIKVATAGREGAIRGSDWRPLERNTLKGFLTLELPSGLILRECTYHRAATGAEWIGLPGKPQLNRDGQQHKDSTTGKALYTPIVELKSMEQRERFQAAALAAVRELLATEVAA